VVSSPYWSCGNMQDARCEEWGVVMKLWMLLSSGCVRPAAYHTVPASTDWANTSAVLISFVTIPAASP
jgi:hypothetical protein